MFTEERKTELLTEMSLKESDIDGNKKYDLMRKIDSINILEIEGIIKQYGYPSKSTVGEPANKAAFYVIQHSNKINKHLGKRLLCMSKKSTIPLPQIQHFDNNSILNKRNILIG